MLATLPHQLVCLTKTASSPLHPPTGSPAVMRRGRSLQLGLSSPDGALLRLHASELDDERLWEVMSAMGLHDKVGGCAGSDTH
jgi:hypothetical protein